MKQGPPLKLDPRVCDRCGACLSACPHDALKIGRTYLSVDWKRCDACGACARVCARRAIAMRDGAVRRATGATAASAHPRPTARRATGTPRQRSASEAASQDGAAAPDKAKGSRVAALFDRTGAAKAAKAPKATGEFRWTLLEAVAMLSVTLAAFTLKEAVVLLPAIGALSTGYEIPVRVVLLVAYYVIQIVVLIWLVRRRGGDPATAFGLRSTGLGVSHALTSAGLVLAGLLTTRLVTAVYSFVTREVGLMPSGTTDIPGLFGSSATGFVLAMLMVVVVGPVVEEAVFRSALLEGLAARLGLWPAIIVQAALFAGFHRSVWMLFPMFVLGVVLGWLAHSRKSLWPAIAVHGLHNAITVAAAFLVSGSG